MLEGRGLIGINIMGWLSSLIWMALGALGALVTLSGGHNTLFEGYDLSLTGFHLCTRSEPRQVSVMVTHHVAYTVTLQCGGWLPLSSCQFTRYRTESRPGNRTVTREVTRCCPGFVQLGSYCALPLDRSRESTSKPGSCSGTEAPSGCKRCEWDVDCAGSQKCCDGSDGFHCQDPASPSHYSVNGEWNLNVTVTVKTDYQRMISTDKGLLNHTRLLHTMVSGALNSSAVSLFYLSSRPVDPFRTSTSLLISCNETLSLEDASSTLSLLLRHIAEVVAVQVEDVDECAHPALRRCSAHADCGNTQGSYRCACHHGYHNVRPSSPGAECEVCPVHPSTVRIPISTRSPTTNLSSTLAPPSPSTMVLSKAAPSTAVPSTAVPSAAAPSTMAPSKGAPSTTEVTTSTCALPDLRGLFASNVTGSSFCVHWSSSAPVQSNLTYLVVLSRGSEVIRPWNTTNTTLEVAGLQPGVLYSLSVTLWACGSPGESLQASVKTAAQTLEATARLTNVNFTADLLNSSSQAYLNLTTSLVEEIYQSLSARMRLLVESGEVSIQVTSLSQGSVVVNFTIVLTPNQGLQTFNSVSMALMTSLANSSKYTMDENNTYISDFDECVTGENDCSQSATCRNTWGSYNCSCLGSYEDKNPSWPGRVCEAISVTTPSETTDQPISSTTAPSTQLTTSASSSPTSPRVLTGALTQASSSPIMTPSTAITSATTIITPTTAIKTPTTPVKIPSAAVTTAIATATTITTPPSTISTPTTTITTPTTTMATPSSAISTPTTTMATPSSAISTPTTTITTPSSAISTPTTTMATPSSAISTPTTTISTTTTTITTPTTTITTPSSAISTPTTTISTPTTTITTPPTAISTPTTTISTPTTTMATPTTTMATTTTTITTPPSAISTPTTTISTPSSAIPTPTTTMTNASTTVTPPSATITTPATAITTPTTVTIPTTTIRTHTATTTPVHATTSIAPITATTSLAITTTTTNVLKTTIANGAAALGAISVQCQATAITVTVTKEFLKANLIDELDLYLGLKECGVNGENETHAQLTVAWDECDTKLLNNDTYYTAQVTLFNRRDSQAGLTLTMQLQVPIMCTYRKSMLVSMDYGPMGLDMLNYVITGSGTFHVTVQLMNGSQPLPQNYSLSREQDVVVEVALNTTAEQIKVVINNCWATPTRSPADPSSRVFLQESCPMPNSSTTILKNGNSSTARLSVRIFSVVDFDITYLHCQVQICVEMGSATCVPNCGGRKARSANSIGRAYAVAGPYLRFDFGSVGEQMDTTQLVGFCILGVGLALLSLAGFACLFFYQRNRIGHHSFTLQPKEEKITYLVFNTTI